MVDEVIYVLFFVEIEHREIFLDVIAYSYFPSMKFRNRVRFQLLVKIANVIAFPQIP